jgi:hypothetical protein
MQRRGIETVVFWNTTSDGGHASTLFIAGACLRANRFTRQADQLVGKADDLTQTVPLLFKLANDAASEDAERGRVHPVLCHPGSGELSGSIVPCGSTLPRGPTWSRRTGAPRGRMGEMSVAPLQFLLLVFAAG